MELSVQQIQERLKKPANRKAIQEAQEHEDRIKLHSKTVNDPSKASPYYHRFLRWVGEGIKLQADKFATFKQMCRFPLATNALADDVYQEYERIFSASDGTVEITMSDTSLREEFEAYLAKIKLRDYFRTDGFKAFQTQPGAIYVVDMPAVQEGPRPAPYFYRVGIQSVRDIMLTRDRIEYVIFETEKDRFVAVDDTHYRVFIKITPENPDQTEYVLLSEGTHGLGYTPATFMIHDPLYDVEDNSSVARRTPLSKVAGDLDWLLFYKTAQRMYETYGPFPIMTVPESNCSFIDAAGNQCSSGYVSFTKQDGVGSYYPCPACKDNNLVGPGTVFSKPVPKDKDQPELRKPVEITPPDIPSLEYITKTIDYLEWEFYESCVGSNDDQVTLKEAINDDQVQSNAEGKRNVLMKIKRHFEITEEFIISTMGRLMYGEYFTDCNVHYGEDFLLYTEKDLITQYQEVKKNGLPVFMISQKKDLLLQSWSKNNTYAQQRLKILNLLEPWTELSLQECLQYQFYTLFPEKFLLKSDFAKFISRFELENGDIVDWGSKIDFPTKIDRISTQLMKYASDEQSNARKIEQPGGNSGSPGTQNQQVPVS